jgi:enolase-phosphatase E1
MKGVDQVQVRVVLLDIEGTTTPIDFVYKTLFPYAGRKVGCFLRDHVGEPEIHSLVRDLREQHDTDQAQGLEPPPWRDDDAQTRTISFVEYVRWLIAKDSKCTPLKSLQGRIWREGFDAGELHGEVYADVPRALARWRKQGREVCIYSSGSVLAQQMLFQTVATGDLTRHIAAFFDTQTGIKTSAESYRKIAASRGHEPREFLFLSDAPTEIEAAQAGGMHAALCDRTASPSASPGARQIVHSFDEVFPD